MAWEYSEKTKQLFMAAVHGEPGTHLGEIEDPDGFGEHGSIVCGDAMRFTFRVKRHPTDPAQDVIVEAKYLTFGCTSAIAASEALCIMIEEGGYTPIQALKVQNSDIVKFLGGLPDPLSFFFKTGALLLVLAGVQSLFARLRIDQTVGLWWRIGALLALGQLLVMIIGKALTA